MYTTIISLKSAEHIVCQKFQITCLLTHTFFLYLHIYMKYIIYYVNPFPNTAILQQMTFRKILNVHSAERNEHFLESWKALKKLWQCFVTMFSNVVCYSRHKNNYLWSKWLKQPPPTWLPCTFQVPTLYITTICLLHTYI